MFKYRPNPRNLKDWPRLIVVALTLAVIGRVMTLTMRDLATYPGIDLRDKVVGARLLIRGMDPYYDFRHEHYPDHLRMVSADTYSPALLLLYCPMCELSWKTQRDFYFFVDWAALLLSYVILVRFLSKSASSTALWVGFVCLFLAGFGFRLHLERGQYYVELALLTAAASACLLRKSDSWVFACPLALLVLARPTYAICIVSLFVLRRTRHAIHAVLLCILLFAATLPLTGIRDWKNYFAEIATNGREAENAAYCQASTQNSSATNKVIEGVDFSKSFTYPGYLADRTLTGLARSSVSPFLARLVHWIAPSKRGFEQLNYSCLLLMCVFDLVVLYNLSRRRVVGLIPVAFVFLAPLNLELLAPQRFSYCDVTILVPVLLILAAMFQRSTRLAWVLFGAVLLTGSVLPFLAIHFDKHVPFASFFSYVGILVILNIISVISALDPARASRAIHGSVESRFHMNYDLQCHGRTLCVMHHWLSV